MSWGAPFRCAWERAVSGGRLAAREAVLGPDKAAGLLSDAIAHTLQRILYAAQDMQRGKKTDEAGIPVPGATVLRRVMDDIRQGRIAPERSEKHLQQAARAAAEQAQSTEPALEDEAFRRNETRLAAQRFADLRARLNEQLAVEHQRMIAQGSPADRDDKTAELQRNVEFARTLVQAFARIDDMFLESKAVDDPSVPLPWQARQIEQKAGMSCLQPRV